MSQYKLRDDIKSSGKSAIFNLSKGPPPPLFLIAIFPQPQIPQCLDILSPFDINIIIIYYFNCNFSEDSFCGGPGGGGVGGGGCGGTCGGGGGGGAR